MASQELIDRVKHARILLESKPDNDEIITNGINAMSKYARYSAEKEDDIEYANKILRYSRKYVEDTIKRLTGGTVWDLDLYCHNNKVSYSILNLYYELYKQEAYWNFESFIYYMEKNRHPSKRFYHPRRQTLKYVVKDLQDLEDGKFKFYGLSMPSRVGKSTICIFFLAWIMLKRPNSHNAMGGHSGILAKGFYKELLNIVTTDEYTFKELFADYHPEYAGNAFPTDKSADEFTLTIGDRDRFATITCRGIDGTWTGAVDVSSDGYLYIDDLVRDREHSLSPTRMENTYQEYLNKMVDRKNDGARELMVGTLWNVLDPLERMKNQCGDNPDYRFRRIPALNENDESNFNYEINGFSTEYYKTMRERLDNAEWMAKYQQQPFVREGLLFASEELRYFNGVLPDGDSRVVAVVDVAWGGGDALSMPIGREYDNGDVYIFDWVYNYGAKEVTLPLVVGKIIQNEIRQLRCEGNVGGNMYSTYIDDELRKYDYKCSCTDKKAPNKMSKMEKIVAYAGDIKRRFIFLSPKIPTVEEKELDEKNGITRFVRSREYQKAMDDLCSFVTIGKNEHDDSPDSLTQLEMFLEGDTVVRQARILKSLF